MPIKISRVIESRLRFLKLTKAGRIRLNVFSDKVLYAAIEVIKVEGFMNDKPFNTFFAACLLKTQMLGEEPNWEQMDTLTYSDGYDSKGVVTLEDEIFDMQECSTIIKEFGKKMHKRPSYDKPYRNSSHDHNTYTQGLQYFKHGHWYPYPDQAISDDFRPCTPADSNCKSTCGTCNVNKKIDRNNIIPEEELAKAIKSGNINKDGLAFLKETLYKTKPNIVKMIDDYLQGDIVLNPDDTQSNLFKD